MLKHSQSVGFIIVGAFLSTSNIQFNNVYNWISGNVVVPDYFEDNLVPDPRRERTRSAIG